MAVRGRRQQEGLSGLYWWLRHAEEHPSKGAHMADVYPTRAMRKAARQELKELAGAEALLCKERTLREDESDSEPEGLA